MGSCKVLSLKYVVEQCEIASSKKFVNAIQFSRHFWKKEIMYFTFNSKSSMLVVFMDETLPPLIVNNCMYLFVVLKTDTVT